MEIYPKAEDDLPAEHYAKMIVRKKRRKYILS
jgi:hypothetical protein